LPHICNYQRPEFWPPQPWTTSIADYFDALFESLSSKIEAVSHWHANYSIDLLPFYSSFYVFDEQFNYFLMPQEYWFAVSSFGKHFQTFISAMHFVLLFWGSLSPYHHLLKHFWFHYLLQP